MRLVRAKKSFGQHFLRDLEIAERIASTIDGVYPNVLEVGPGTGVLTQFLLQNEHIALKAVEVDRESVAFLREHFPHLTLIEGDFLRVEMADVFSRAPFAVIGNFPYNISSQIFFKVLENKEFVPFCVGMVQKEVAERLSAHCGSRAYGIVSVLLQAYYDIEYLFTVEPEVFVPPPKVRSAVIRLRRNERAALSCDEELFKQVVKTSFNQRRKQMRNSLKGMLAQKAHLAEMKIFDKRPEQLSVEEFIELTNVIKNN